MDSKKNLYNRLSQFYDFLSGNREKRLGEYLLNQMDFPPSSRVLEIGFGTGASLVYLAQNFQGLEITGIDLSPGMKDRAQKRPSLSSVKLLVGDGRDLPFDEGAFQRVYLTFTLELFSPQDRARVLSQLYRVLDPQGVLGVVSLSQEQSTWFSRFYEKMHYRFPHYLDCCPIWAGTALESAGFVINTKEIKSLWGLPCEILTASKGL